MELRTLAAAGLRTECILAGPRTAPPVLLLHGGGIERARNAWAAVLPAWRDRFRMIAPDLPGYGATEGFRGPHGIPDLCRWTLALMDGLDLPSAHMVGNSMGGGIALRLALDHPGRVRRLVPVGAYGIAPRMWAQPVLWLSTRVGGSRLVGQSAARSRLGAWLALRVVVRDPTIITEQMLRGLQREAAVQTRRQTFRRFLEAEVTPKGFRSSVLARLPGLRAEVLYVHGRADRIVHVRHARRAVQVTPHARLWELDAGHWPMRECPDAFCDRVGRFLEQGFSPDRCPAGSSR